MQWREMQSIAAGRGFVAGLAVAVMTLIVGGPAARAASLDDTDLKPKKNVDYSNVTKAGSELTDFSLSAEIEDDGLEADRAAAEQARRDESRLKDELAQMKQQKKLIESEKDKVKADTKAAFDSLAAQNKRNVETRKELEKAKKEKAIEDQKNAAVRQELQTVVSEGNALKEEQHKIDMYIQMAKQERADAIRRMSEMRAQANMTRQRQQTQMKQIEIYRKKTKEFVERETAKSRAIAARNPASGR
jgi:flagellar biosynthesis GTPase FlhF